MGQSVVDDVVVFVDGFIGLGIGNWWVSGRLRFDARMPLFANVSGKIAYGKNPKNKSCDLSKIGLLEKKTLTRVNLKLNLRGGKRL